MIKLRGRAITRTLLFRRHSVDNCMPAGAYPLSLKYTFLSFLYIFVFGRQRFSQPIVSFCIYLRCIQLYYTHFAFDRTSYCHSCLTVAVFLLFMYFVSFLTADVTRILFLFLGLLNFAC